MFRLMKEQLEFIKLIVARLDAAGIPYMLTGSVAMAIYAEPRMTRDIDVVIECRPDDAPVIARLFEPDCYLNSDAIRAAIATRSLFNVIHTRWSIKADFIVRKQEPYRKVEFERRRQIEIDGLTVWVAAPEDLILSKLAWAKDSHSAQQLRDVRALVAAVPNLDRDYLQKWAAQLGVETTLTGLRSP